VPSVVGHTLHCRSAMKHAGMSHRIVLKVTHVDVRARKGAAHSMSDRPCRSSASTCYWQTGSTLHCSGPRNQEDLRVQEQ
jgi:hypothetical protein